uniref:Uncharacterized protein n=1 Tax=Fagus sylvatica TaxID=28930 RepID=A0A2N9ED96_FAGSY
MGIRLGFWVKTGCGQFWVFDGGSRWVGEPIWVLGVAVVGCGRWGSQSGFSGLQQRGY